MAYFHTTVVRRLSQNVSLYQYISNGNNPFLTVDSQLKTDFMHKWPLFLACFIQNKQVTNHSPQYFLNFFAKFLANDDLSCSFIHLISQQLPYMHRVGVHYTKSGKMLFPEQVDFYRICVQTPSPTFTRFATYNFLQVVLASQVSVGLLRWGEVHFSRFQM